MPQLQAVRASLHGLYSWLPYSHYRFAAKDSYAPLQVHEFKQAGAVSPIVFIKSEEGYTPIQMMGLQAGTNLLVSEQGEWLGSYVPACYRSHPFCMAKNENGEALLCFHQDSEFVLDQLTEGIAKPFLNGSELSDELKEIKNFMQAIEDSRKASTAFCATCEDLDLFSPWQAGVSSSGELVPVKGLFCIDEDKLKLLPVDKVISLLESGAMAAIYYHLGSLHLCDHLAVLKRLHDKVVVQENAESPISDLFGQAPKDDGIDLDW